MKVIKLTNKHSESVKQLFFSKNKFMGTPQFYEEEDTFEFKMYQIFCDTYLSDLENFHAYGILDQDKKVSALIAFYESDDEASWFLTIARSVGRHELFKYILDDIIEHNEKNGRLKFFTLVNAKHAHPRIWRKFTFSKKNDERYGYFDEYLTEARHKCFWSSHWEILYKRTLIPIDTVVRCTFLKQEYRDTLPAGGNI